MNAELEKFYSDNEERLEAAWHEHCAEAGKFDSSRAARQYANSDKAFWEFIEEIKEEES